AVMPAIPYCIDLIGGAYIDTDPNKIKAFRPKK
ncbi:MAG: molybdopterin adenylyltransferase, partial [Aquifex sp.]